MSTQRARKPDAFASTSPTASTILPARTPKQSSTLLPPPLTPPSSEQKSRPQISRNVVEDITKEIEKRKVGSGFSTNPWLRFKLSPIDYECWQQQYQEDGFVQEPKSRNWRYIRSSLLDHSRQPLTPGCDTSFSEYSALRTVQHQLSPAQPSRSSVLLPLAI